MSPASSPPTLQQQNARFHNSPPPASHASRCSLRGASHPLGQNPVDSFDQVDLDDAPILRPPPPSATAYRAHPHSPSADRHADHGDDDQHPGLHQRSLTGSFIDNCQPFFNKATSTLQQRASLHSPTKSLASFIPTRNPVESTATQPTLRAGAKALQNWFNGHSAAVNLGVGPPSPSKEDADHEYESAEEEDEDEDPPMMPSLFTRAPATSRPQTQRSSAPPTTHSKFAWLLNTQKNAAVPSRVPSPTYHNADDELLNLNVSQALFPHGPVDPLAPSSFNDLLTTAESLVSRYQSSYRQLSTSLADAQAEQSARDDELDEAETRVRHLKMQLESMAARANEQDEQMKRLMEELVIEREARHEEEAARKRSLALVRNQTAHEEPRRRHNRVSNSDVSIDSGFESECEASDAASVFSRNCLSPTGTEATSVLSAQEADTTPKSKKPQLVQRRSTYDKVRNGTVNLEKGGWGCQNCEGGAQAAVWGRLAREREENYMLRKRVDQLEDAVEGALNVVDGLWGA